MADKTDFTEPTEQSEVAAEEATGVPTYETTERVAATASNGESAEKPADFVLKDETVATDEELDAITHSEYYANLVALGFKKVNAILFPFQVEVDVIELSNKL